MKQPADKARGTVSTVKKLKRTKVPKKTKKGAKDRVPEIKEEVKSKVKVSGGRKVVSVKKAKVKTTVSKKGKRVVKTRTKVDKIAKPHGLKLKSVQGKRLSKKRRDRVKKQAVASDE